MYKILLVEDELYIRRGLKNHIDWSRIGFEVISEASNGMQALDKIKKINPHVILTDIKMPVMGGIELLEKVNAIYPEIIVVMLTGYADFEYAQKCIELKAFSYILKPTDEDKIYGVFNKIKLHLDSVSTGEANANCSKIVIIINDYIRNNIFEKITLVQLSELVYMNKSYISTYYKNQTGINIRDFILQEKIKKAKLLMNENNYKIYEISDMIGYMDFRTFSKAFKKVEGMNPKEYLQKNED